MRNKALVITGILLFIIAAILLIVGAYLEGWDFAAFFKSSTFVWIIVLLSIYLIGVGVVLIMDRINKL